MRMSAKTRTSSVPQGYQHQADATLSQVNPVSTTLYTVLDTTKNVRLLSIDAKITWATTQPTPLEVVVTIDGVSIVFGVSNPVSAQDYHASLLPYVEAANEQLFATSGGISDMMRAFLLEGRSVKVQVRITWATTQPTPLICRVKYAKIA